MSYLIRVIHHRFVNTLTNARRCEYFDRDFGSEDEAPVREKSAQYVRGFDTRKAAREAIKAYGVPARIGDAYTTYAVIDETKLPFYAQ